MTGSDAGSEIWGSAIAATEAVGTSAKASITDKASLDNRDETWCMEHLHTSNCQLLLRCVVANITADEYISKRAPPEDLSTDGVY